MVIKDAISNVTLVMGDDPSLVYQTLERFIANVEELHGDDIEKVTFQAGEVTVNEVISCWSQNYIFAPRALVILRDPSNLTAEQSEVLLAGLEKIQSENYLVLVNFTGKIDKKLQVYFTQRKAIMNSSLANRKERVNYLGDLVANSGLRFMPDAYQLLKDSLGEDVGRAEPILGLLRARLGDGLEVTSEILSSYLGDPGDAMPWDITDAIEAGDVARASDVLGRMMNAGGRHPLVILAILQRRFTELALLCSTEVRSATQASAILKARDKNYRAPEWSVKKLLGSAKRLGNTRLTKAFVLMALADRQIKGEGGLSSELAMELLVARLAQTMKVR